MPSLARLEANLCIHAASPRHVSAGEAPEPEAVSPAAEVKVRAAEALDGAQISARHREPAASSKQR